MAGPSCDRYRSCTFSNVEKRVEADAPWDIAMLVYGANFTDHFWFKPFDLAFTYADIRFTDNPADRIALNGGWVWINHYPCILRNSPISTVLKNAGNIVMEPGGYTKQKFNGIIFGIDGFIIGPTIGNGCGSLSNRWFNHTMSEFCGYDHNILCTHFFLDG